MELSLFVLGHGLVLFVGPDVPAQTCKLGFEIDVNSRTLLKYGSVRDASAVLV